MRAHLPLLLSALLCAAGTAAAAHATPQAAEPSPAPRIIGGTEAPIGRYPAMARIEVTVGANSWGCGATLASTNALITAQHCIRGKNAKIVAHIGDVDRTKGVVATVVGIKAGDGSFDKSDWAVLKLDRDITGIATTVLSGDPRLDVGPTFWAAGWGNEMYEEQLRPTQLLRHVELPFVPNDQCEEWGHGEICAGVLGVGGKDTCKGDSGGPLYKELPDGRMAQVGITSWGVGCAEPTHMGHYAHISWHREDIDKAVKALGVAPFTYVTAGESAPAPSSPKPPTTRIVGGTEADASSYPWIALINVSYKGGKTGPCTASIISPDFLLTAQHCLRDAVSLTAHIGATAWKDGQQRTATRWEVGKGPTEGDWAIVKLDQPITLPSYVKLPTDTVHDQGPMFTAMGWGSTKFNGPQVDRLREVDLPYSPYDYICEYTHTEICAGYPEGGKDTCQGDSGGPLLKQVGREWLAVGIVSWGAGCGEPESAGHYTKVSAFTADMRQAMVRLGGTPPA